MLIFLPLVVISGSQNGHCRPAIYTCLSQDRMKRGAPSYLSLSVKKAKASPEAPLVTSPYISRPLQVSKGAGKAGNKILMIDLDRCRDGYSDILKKIITSVSKEEG